MFNLYAVGHASYQHTTTRLLIPCDRVGRECIYELGQKASTAGEPRSQYSLNAAFAIPSSDSLDPFQYTSLRQPTFDVFVTKQASKVLGDVNQIEETVARYFDTIFLRMPVLSRNAFTARLSKVYTHPQADFTLLCLSIHLLIQRPDELESAGNHEQTMHSSTYVMIRSFVGVLQSLATPTVEFIQAMLLVAFFEMGHGIYPAASISIATCARSAHAIGLNKRPVAAETDPSLDRVLVELRARVWWSILILDRYVPQR